MAAAYICDRCGESKRGSPVGDAFVSERSSGNVERKTLVKLHDLCAGCVRDIAHFASTTSPPRKDPG